MGIFRQFPYSNFHEMNLDEFLKMWKSFTEEFEVLNHTVTEALEAFKEYIENYIESLDIYDTTKTILEEWLQDGTLENFFKMFLFPQRELIIARERREISTPEAPVGAQTCFYDGEYYYFAGNDIFNGGSVINKVTPDNVVLETHSSNDWGHTNSIAVTDTEIFIAMGNSNKVIILDKQTYTTKSVITDDNFNSIWGISYNNNHMYVIGNDADAPSSLLAFGEIVDGEINIIHRISVPASAVRQNMCVYGSTIYILFNMATIVYCYNLEDGELIDALFVPNSDGYFPVGETEDLVIVDDRIMLLGASYPQYDLSNITIVIPQLFNSNILEHTIVQKNNRYSYMFSETRMILNVDDRLTPAVNPVDTFTTIEEACLIANFHRTADIRCAHIDSGYIHLLNGHYTVVCNAGARTFNRIWVENSTFTLSQVAEIRSTVIRRCNAILKRVTLSGNMEVNVSNIQLIQPTLTSLESIISVRSEWKFLGLVGSVNSALTIDSSFSEVEIFARNTNYMFLLLKIATPGQGTCSIFMHSENLSFGIATAEINAGAFTRTIRGVAISYADGVLSGVDTAFYIESKGIA